MERVSVYVDGFNLYYGLRARGWRRYYWLDLRSMAENLLRPNQTLVRVRYFTANLLPISDAQDKRTRQEVYLNALETLPDLSIHYGRFLPKDESCRECGAIWTTYEEKMTDVNIAVELLSDAYDDAFDTAMLVSADSDLSGPMRTVHERYPDKRVIVAFPPRRHSVDLRNAAAASFTIGRGILSRSQLPDSVVKPDGYALTRPASWR